jgi:hypothetical protein
MRISCPYNSCSGAFNDADFVPCFTPSAYADFVLLRGVQQEELHEALVFKNVESMHQIPCGDGTSCGNSYIYSLQRLEKAGLSYEARQVERIVKRNAKEFNKEAKLAHCSRSDVTKASIPVTTKSHINDVCCKCSRNRFAKLCACVFFQ